MQYDKKKHVDGNDIQISFWSTDDNILCKNGKTLRENIEALNEKYEKLAKKIGTATTAFEITSFTISPSVAQRGSAVNVTLKWGYNDNIKNQKINNVEIEASLREKTYNSISANTTYTLVGTSENDSEKNKSVSITFCNGIYYGKSYSQSYDSSLINSLTKVLSDNKERTISVNAGSGEYIYYCLPTRLGTPTFSVGGFSGGFNKVATISFTNNDGYSENYNIYKSAHDNLGLTTITIK